MTWLYAWRDLDDPWLGDDKQAHVLGGIAAYLLAVRVWSGVWPWVAVFVAGLVVELVELIRYRVWERKGRPQPWPTLCDKVSRKDLVADMLGAALAAGVMWLTR